MMIILTIGVIVRFAITVLLKGSVKFCSLLLSGAGEGDVDRVSILVLAAIL